jgi:putative PIN family toxin of toxin-antitoxin system
MQQLSTKPQVVIDTNVWISGLIFGGNPEKVIRHFIDGNIIVITSEELLSELRRKITKRFPLFISSLASLDASIRERAMIVQLGSIRINASRDVDDNKFIETAVIGNASYIVSGDKDLLVLENYKDITILKPADFLRTII